MDCTIEQVKTAILGKGTTYPLYGELSQRAGTHQGRDAGRVKIDRQVRPINTTTLTIERCQSFASSADSNAIDTRLRTYGVSITHQYTNTRICEGGPTAKTMFLRFRRRMLAYIACSALFLITVFYLAGDDLQVKKHATYLKDKIGRAHV